MPRKRTLCPDCRIPLTMFAAETGEEYLCKRCGWTSLDAPPPSKSKTTGKLMRSIGLTKPIPARVCRCGTEMRVFKKKKDTFVTLPLTAWCPNPKCGLWYDTGYEQQKPILIPPIYIDPPDTPTPRTSSSGRGNLGTRRLVGAVL